VRLVVGAVLFLTVLLTVLFGGLVLTVVLADSGRVGAALVLMLCGVPALIVGVFVFVAVKIARHRRLPGEDPDVFD